MIAWAQGWVPPRAGSRSCAADQRLLSALLASTCASPHILCACTCTLGVFPTTQTSIKQINREQTTKAEQANCSLWDMIISLVHEVYNNVRKGKEWFLVYSLNTQAEFTGSDLWAFICLLPGIVIWCFTATGFCVWVLKLCFTSASPRGEKAGTAALQEAILPKAVSSQLQLVLERKQTENHH